MRAAIRGPLTPIRRDLAPIRAVRRSILRNLASIRPDHGAIRRALRTIRVDLRDVLPILLRVGATNLSVRRHLGLLRGVHTRFRRHQRRFDATDIDNDVVLTRGDAIKPNFHATEPRVRRTKLANTPLRGGRRRPRIRLRRVRSSIVSLERKVLMPKGITPLTLTESRALVAGVPL